MSSARPSVSSWSAAAGRYGSAATSSGRRPSLTMCRASFAAVVVLPEPWSPTSEMTAGLPWRRNVRSPRREQLDELVVDDLHDLLAGGEAAQDLRADGLLADPPDDVLDDLEVDVGLEQGQPDLARGGIDVRLADPAAAGQVGERLAQSIAEVVEHAGELTPCGDPVGAGAATCRGARTRVLACRRSGV